MALLMRYDGRMKTTNIKAMTKDPLAWPACCAANAINAFAGVIAAAMVIAGQAAAATASKPSPRAQETQNVPPVATNEQALYQFLIAEIAGQRGRAQLAATGMLDLAARTRDHVARRFSMGVGAGKVQPSPTQPRVDAHKTLLA